MGTRRPTIAGLTGALLLAACGGPADRDATDERSCAEVIESLDEPNRVRADTFGGGPEGREAMATIIGTILQRPDCFSDEDVELAAEFAKTLPSASEADAIEAAEAACDELGGGFGGRPDDVTYDSPEEAIEALAEDTGGRLEGVAERSSEGDGRVEFVYHDDAGVYRGWVMVERAETGWFVSWGITCLYDSDEDDPGSP